jgi:hypothetical protein
MKTRMKPADKTPEFPVTKEVYNDDLSRAMHDMWRVRQDAVELKDKIELAKDALTMEMEKAGKMLVVGVIDGCRFVVELVPQTKKLKFKK